MIKHFLKAFAIAALIGAQAMASDATGTYVAQTARGPMTMELRPERGQLGGTIHFQGTDVPLMAIQTGDKIRGAFKGKDGRTYGFAGSFDASGTLNLEMLGSTMHFKSQAAATPAAPAAGAPVAAPVPATAPAAVNPLDPGPAAAANVPAAAPAAAAPTTAPAAAPADGLHLVTRQGKSLQCDVPAGWSFSDTNNGVDSVAPDGITWMSRTFLRGVGRSSPQLLMQRSSANWANFGMTNVKVVSVKDVNPQSKVYELDYLYKNRPAHAVVQATVQPGPTGAGYLANMITLQSSREAFQQNLPVMIAMAKSVRVTDPNQFADSGKLDDLAKKRSAIAAQSAKDIGDIYIQGQTARSHVQDESNKGASDTLRSNTRFKDASGTEYVGPLQAVRAFKHADGTVTFTSNVSAPVPSDATELTPYDYTGK